MRKNLFRSFPALLLSALLALTAASCGVEDKAEDAVPRLTVDKNRVEITKNGMTANGDVATLRVIANKGYTITSDSPWLSVDQAEGIGSTDVKILAENNESGDVRQGILNVTSLNNLKESILVCQNLEEVKDDGNPVGHVYFFDDFAWAVGGTDAVADDNSGSARNIYTWGYESNGFENPLPKFQATYDDLNSNAKTVYTMAGYLKFDKTNTITAIAIKNNGITPGYTVNVAVKFKCAFLGSDKCNIVVGLEGDGTIEGGSVAGNRMVSPVVPMSTTRNTWTEVSVNIKGATSQSVIILGDQTYVKDGVNDSGTFRWYLDDLSVERI